jgi:hypothetical protein
MGHLTLTARAGLGLEVVYQVYDVEEFGTVCCRGCKRGPLRWQGDLLPVAKRFLIVRKCSQRGADDARFLSRWDAGLLDDDDSSVGDANRHTGAVAQFIGLAGTEAFSDPIDEARCHSAQGLP